jgi:hypothetical protein
VFPSRTPHSSVDAPTAPVDTGPVQVDAGSGDNPFSSAHLNPLPDALGEAEVRAERGAQKSHGPKSMPASSPSSRSGTFRRTTPPRPRGSTKWSSIEHRSPLGSSRLPDLRQEALDHPDHPLGGGVQTTDRPQTDHKIVVNGGLGRSLQGSKKWPLTSVFMPERRPHRHLRKPRGERSGR